MLDTWFGHNRDMPFLLRVELPDVPGSLGMLATALGAAGADIEAIQIVEHRADGIAIDDVLLELPVGALPDSLITACHAIEGVKVLWISRYHAGANLSMDLETVEAFTAEPQRALERLVDAVPTTFRTDWALAVALDTENQVLHSTAAAPRLTPEMLATIHADRLDDFSGFEEIPATLAAAVSSKTGAGTHVAIIAGRHGGPEFIASERARLEHMTALAASLQNR